MGRALLLKWSLVAGLAAAFLGAPRLWLRHPFLAPIPVFDAEIAIPAPWDAVVLAVLVGALLPILWPRRTRRFILVWCGLFAARSAWDAVTWQPFFFQYFFMLLALACYDWNAEPGSRRNVAALDVARLIAVLVYFWSGASKLHHAFVTEAGPTFLQPFLDPLGLHAGPWTAGILAVVEAALAVGLLFPRVCRFALVGVVLMHGAILASIGPWGHDHNPVVWPWNVAMAAIAVILFRGERTATPARVFFGSGCRYRYVVLFLFGLAPLLSYAGLWSPYLSFRLYADRYPKGFILVSDAVRDRLPPEVNAYLVPQRWGEFAGHFKIEYWSEGELGAFAPFEPLVFKRIASRFAPYAPNPKHILLLIDDPPDWMTGDRRQRRFDLRDL